MLEATPGAVPSLASEASTFRLSGSITLSPVVTEVLEKYKGGLDWIECRGDARAPDLTYRALVTVTDDEEEIVGQHILGSGVLNADTRACLMQFAVEVKEGNSSWYRVRIGDQEPFQVSSPTARGVGAHVSIGY